MRETKIIKAWGGFSDGRLHKIDEIEPQYDDGGCSVQAIFKSKKAAKLRYQDVRRIEIHMPLIPGMRKKGF